MCVLRSEAPTAQRRLAPRLRVGMVAELRGHGTAAAAPDGCIYFGVAYFCLLTMPLAPLGFGLGFLIDMMGFGCGFEGQT